MRPVARRPVAERLRRWLTARAMGIREGDGTAIESIRTGGGTQIAEVRTGDGRVLWSAAPDIPDSGDLQAAYDATKLSLSDGQSVSTWTDESGNEHDLTAGTAPTYTASGINANPVVRFDGVDDYLNVSFSAQSQPVTIFLVAQPVSAQENKFERVFDGYTDRFSLYTNDGGGEDYHWALNAGTGLNSSTNEDSNPHIFSIRFGSTDVMRLDGTEILSGDAGSNSMDGLTVGSTAGQSQFGDYDIGEILVYPSDKSGSYSEIEGYLSDKWGIAV